MATSKSTLFLGDLSTFCTERDIHMAFAPYGEVLEIKIMRSEETYRNLSYGFIKFANPNAAKKAMNGLNGVLFCGRHLRVGWASYKNKKEPKLLLHHDRIESSSVHVSYISYQLKNLITEESLRVLFSTYGVVLDTSIKKSYIDESINRQCGYGFVHFASSQEGIESALAAVAGLNDATIDNICYKCSVSHNLEKYLLELQQGQRVDMQDLYRSPENDSPVDMNEMHSFGAHGGYVDASYPSNHAVRYPKSTVGRDMYGNDSPSVINPPWHRTSPPMPPMAHEPNPQWHPRYGPHANNSSYPPAPQHYGGHDVHGSYLPREQLGPHAYHEYYPKDHHPALGYRNAGTLPQENYNFHGERAAASAHYYPNSTFYQTVDRPELNVTTQPVVDKSYFPSFLENLNSAGELEDKFSSLSVIHPGGTVAPLKGLTDFAAGNATQPTPRFYDSLLKLSNDEQDGYTTRSSLETLFDKAKHELPMFTCGSSFTTSSTVTSSSSALSSNPTTASSPVWMDSLGKGAWDSEHRLTLSQLF